MLVHLARHETTFHKAQTYTLKNRSSRRHDFVPFDSFLPALTGPREGHKCALVHLTPLDRRLTRTLTGRVRPTRAPVG